MITSGVHTMPILVRGYAFTSARSRHHKARAVEASLRVQAAPTCASLRPGRQGQGGAARGCGALTKALPDNRYGDGDNVIRGGGSSTLAAVGLPLPPPPPSRGQGTVLKPPGFLQPLLGAVVAVSGGRLALLPPGAVAWLLRALLSLGHQPPAAWLAEAYGRLTAGLDELQPSEAAQAYLAIASLAAASHTRQNVPAAAAPSNKLLSGLYGSLARSGRRGFLDPRLALACLEAAAGVEAGGAAAAARSAAGPGPTFVPENEQAVDGRPGSEAVEESSFAGHDGDAARVSGDGSRAKGALESRSCRSDFPRWWLSPAMPQATTELLVRRAVGLAPLEGAPGAVAASEAADAPSAVAMAAQPEVAVAAARAVIASAYLANPPRRAAVTDLAAVIAENSGADGPFGVDSRSGGGGGAPDPSPHLLVESLAALGALGTAPLPATSLTALLTGLEDLLPQLDADQLSYCVAAVNQLATEPPAAAAAVLRFARGPAAAELARRLRGLPAPRLAAALAVLPPPLRPPPAELAAAAHDALRGCLAAADSDDLAEVLRQLSESDSLPLYGWQGALATDIGTRLQDARAAALLSSQELCNALFMLAALNYRPSFSWTAAAASALQPRLLTLTAPQLTNTLWALAKFGYRAEGAWSTSAVQALQLQLPSLRPHQLSYGLGSLQRMGCLISPAVLDEMLVAAAEQLRQYPPADLVLLLMTVARLRHVPSYSFTEAVTERLRPHVAAGVVSASEASDAPLPEARDPWRGVVSSASSAAPATSAAPLTCQELVSVGYALAKLHSRPEADWMAAYMDACLAVMKDLSPDLMASLLWAVVELGQVPSPAWMFAFLAAARPRLREFAPQDLVSVLSSLAALRSPPPAEWLGDALTVLGARVGGLDGAGVAALLKALVDLDARVSNPEWYDALCDQVSGFLPLMSPQSLVDLVASLGVLGHKPGAEWLQRCSAAATRVQAQAQAQARQAGGSAPAAATARPMGAAGGLGGGDLILSGSGGAAGSGGGGGLSAQQLEALVCGLARLGAVPPLPLLQAFFAATATSLAVMPPERVTALASALAGAKVAPEPAWLDGLATAVRNDVMSYTLVQLDALTRALAVFQGLVPEHGATKDLLAFLREFCLYG